jgi:hypothetical protein
MIKWSQKEINLLIKTYKNSTKNELISLFPNRTYEAIKLMGCKLKLKKEINELILGDLKILLNDTPETYYNSKYL